MFHSTATGWQETLVCPSSQAVGRPRIAFDQNQKIHIFASLVSAGTDFHE